MTFLNVKRQAEMTIEQEHVKWIRERRNALYADLLTLFNSSKWENLPNQDAAQWAELDLVSREALMYATEVVLESVQTLSKVYRDERDSRSHSVPLAERLRATMVLVRNIRSELAGPDEASKTWRRYERDQRS